MGSKSVLGRSTEMMVPSNVWSKMRWVFFAISQFAQSPRKPILGDVCHMLSEIYNSCSSLLKKRQSLPRKRLSHFPISFHTNISHTATILHCERRGHEVCPSPIIDAQNPFAGLFPESITLSEIDGAMMRQEDRRNQRDERSGLRARPMGLGSLPVCISSMTTQGISVAEHPLRKRSVLRHKSHRAQHHRQVKALPLQLRLIYTGYQHPPSIHY